jgi:hypothetical protein
LVESFRPLSKIKDNDLFIKNLSETTIRLINDGYSPDEIALVVEQEAAAQTATEPSTSLWGGLKDPATGKINIWDTIMGGGKSWVTEQIIRFIFVDILGFSEMNGQSIGVFLAQASVMDVIKLFRGYGRCVEGAPDVARGVVSVFINNSQFGGQSQQVMTGGGLAKTGLRNIAMQAVEESNLDNVLAEKICNYIWNKSTTQPVATPQLPAAQPTAQLPATQPTAQLPATQEPEQLG